ncbi:MAG: hypothetical protein SFT92_07905 [Rickettsiales bacterium]|nr:hypothetical protein [Rickettsiales bacterium]
MSTPEKKITVFYHHPCLDGSCAIWALNDAWKDKGYEINWVGLGHNDDNVLVEKKVRENVNAETDVYFVDFVPKDIGLVESLVTGENKAKSLTIYDHHITALRATKDFQKRHAKNLNVKVVFDMDRSGAAIAWDEEHPTMRGKRPQIVELAQKSDLLRLKGEDEEAIAAYVDAYTSNDPEDILYRLTQLNEMSLKDLRDRGLAVSAQLRAATKRAIEHMTWAMVDILPNTDPVPVPYILVEPSNIGRLGMRQVIELAEKSFPFVAFVVRQEGDTMVTSIRCAKDLHIAEEVAVHLGTKYGRKGGGHADQGSFQMTIPQHDKLFGMRGTQAKVFEQWRASQRNQVEAAIAESQEPVLEVAKA